MRSSIFCDSVPGLQLLVLSQFIVNKLTDVGNGVDIGDSKMLFFFFVDDYADGNVFFKLDSIIRTRQMDESLKLNKPIIILFSKKII